MMNLPPAYKALVSLDRQDTGRFYTSLAIAISFHLFLIFIGWTLYMHLFPKSPKLHKIDTENLLVLKRGSSLDKSANTRGAPKPQLASPDIANTSQPSPAKRLSQALPTTQTHPNTQPQKPQKHTQTSQTPLPQTQNQSTQNTYDPKNLQFFDPAASTPPISQNQARPNSARSLEKNKGLDKQTRRDIDELYGDEWGDLGSAERDFITSNLREIARITQSYLSYPPTAGYLSQSGENAIEFYLLPNGDIDGLKLLLSSGFVLLDKNSTKTIEIAYKDYPRPKQKTLIRFHITYILY